MAAMVESRLADPHLAPNVCRLLARLPTWRSTATICSSVCWGIALVSPGPRGRCMGHLSFSADPVFESGRKIGAQD